MQQAKFVPHVDARVGQSLDKELAILVDVVRVDQWRLEDVLADPVFGSVAQDALHRRALVEDISFCIEHADYVRVVLNQRPESSLAPAQTRLDPAALRDLPLGPAVEAGVVHRQGGAAGQVLGDPEVGWLVASSRLGRDEGDRAQGLSGGVERHDHGRGEADLVDETKLLLVAGRSLEHLIGDLGQKLGSAGPKHLGDPDGGIGVRRVAFLELAGPGDLLRVLMGDGEPLDRSALPEHVDGVPVRQLGYHEACHAVERGAVVQRGGQHLARVGEEAQRLVYPLALDGRGENVRH